MGDMSTAHRIGIATGIELEYEDWGEGVPPLVLVHGFTGSRDDWREVLPSLTPLGRTIAVDQRGHGGSTKTRKAKTYTLDQLARDLEAFHASMALGPWDLLGHSMGGMVALRFALARPDCVRSLILMDTSPHGVPLAPEATLRGGARLGRMAGMGAIAWVMRKGEETEPRLAPAARKWVERQGEDAFWQRTATRLEQMDPEGFLALGMALSVQESVEGRLGEIRCPTTIIVGEQDTAFLPPADALARGIPHAHKVVIPDAAHSAQQEATDAWLAVLRGHIERVRAA